ncbi:MAG: SUMF1/EgtB/PvdO family nonheme iron enzyme, partial [Planctomycetota bacterium]
MHASRPEPPRRPWPRAAVAAGIALIACAGGSCGSEADSTGGGPFAATLDELERLAYVRAGRTTRATAFAVGSPIDLLVDRFEVSWALWDDLAEDPAVIPSAFRPEARYASPEAVPANWMTDVPVVGSTLGEAAAFARVRGMRLPTFEEWMWCALGPAGRRTPSGRSQVNLANTLELGLGAPTPVGSFEAGSTPVTGVFDLVGNVWEWVQLRGPAPRFTDTGAVDALERIRD